MGYRSDVYYVIAFPSDDEMAAFIAQAKALSGQVISASDVIALGKQMNEGRWGNMVSALDECQIHWHKEADPTPPFIGFYTESVKWYETYDDVQSHESLISLAALCYYAGGHVMTYFYPGGSSPPQSCSRIAYEFMRLGEDDNDVEKREGGVSRLVNCAWIQRRIRAWDAVSEILGIPR